MTRLTKNHDLNKLEKVLTKTESIILYELRNWSRNKFDLEDAIDHAKDHSDKYITWYISKINRKSLQIYKESIIESIQKNWLLHYRLKSWLENKKKWFFDKEKNIKIISWICIIIIVVELIHICLK